MKAQSEKTLAAAEIAVTWMERKRRNPINMASTIHHCGVSQNREQSSQMSENDVVKFWRAKRREHEGKRGDVLGWLFVSCGTHHRKREERTTHVCETLQQSKGMAMREDEAEERKGEGGKKEQHYLPFALSLLCFSAFSRYVHGAGNDHHPFLMIWTAYRYKLSKKNETNSKWKTLDPHRRQKQRSVAEKNHAKEKENITYRWNSAQCTN